MQHKLIQIFTDIGHSDKEASVLSLLFEYTALKASEISTKTKINRTTTYSVLKGLEQSGLVTTVEKYGVTLFQSIPPKQLPQYIERKRSELTDAKRAIKNMMPALLDVRKSEHVLPRVSLFQGEEGVKQAYEDTLDNNKEGKILVFSGPDIVFERMGSEYVDYYVKKRKHLGIESFQIAPSTEWGEHIKAADIDVLRYTKLIPSEYAFDTEMVMYDNKLGIFSFSKDTLIAVIIEDISVVNTMKALFSYISDVTK